MTNKIGMKICGMRDPENIIQVGELHPDYMGFIFYTKSKRYVGGDFKIPTQLDRNIKRVGVFVNESTEKMLDLAKLHDLDFIQLHGGEPINQCIELRKNGLGVIKVFSIDQQFDFAEVIPFKQNADYFLFDTKSESYGGTGKTFDWNLLNKYDQEVPFFLSGGLSIENSHSVKTLKEMNLHAVDINSCVEILQGLKDAEEIKHFKSILNSIF